MGRGGSGEDRSGSGVGRTRLGCGTIAVRPASGVPVSGAGPFGGVTVVIACTGRGE
jgi:hypothetical protein